MASGHQVVESSVSIGTSECCTASYNDPDKRAQMGLYAWIQPYKGLALLQIHLCAGIWQEAETLLL